MAHITLIRPPCISSSHTYVTVLEPPLGLAYVAAALESAGHTVVLIDAQGEAPDARAPAAWPGLVAYGLAIDEIVRRIPRNTDGIGLSVMFSQQWPHAEALTRAIGAELPTVPLFVGGEHATATWKYLLAHCPEVTLCVLGEGEHAAVDIADWLDGKHSLDAIPGIARRVDGRPCRTVARPRIRQADKLPWPAWHLVPLENYLSRGLGQGINRGRSIPILATRGCPFQCTFCSSPAMWTTRYVVRSVIDVADEIETYADRYGITNVDFEDLTAFIKREWVLDLCREIERRDIRVTFQLPSGTRSEALDREVLAALYRVGVRNITYAPESGSTRTLERIKKRVRLDRMIDSMQTAAEIGLVVKVNMIIGFPFETRDDVWETLRFCLKLARIGVEDIPLFPFIPYPGTELYDELRRDGLLPELSNDYFASLTFTDMTQVARVCRGMSPTEINLYRVGGMAAALATAYATHPGRLLRTMRNLVTGKHESHVEHRLATLFRLPTARSEAPPATTPREVRAATGRPSALQRPGRPGQARGSAGKARQMNPPGSIASEPRGPDGAEIAESFRENEARAVEG